MNDEEKVSNAEVAVSLLIVFIVMTAVFTIVAFAIVLAACKS